MNPSSLHEDGPASTPNPQRSSMHLHRSPYGASSSSRPEDSPSGPGSGSGRQRVRTEPSPRHAQASSGWLGPYNEQLSPMPARSPRAPRLATTPDRTQTGGAGSGSDRILDTNRALGSWQHDGTSPSTVGSDGGFRRKNFEPKHNDGGHTGGQMEPSNSIQSLVESIDDDNVFRLTEMTKKRVEHNNPAQKRTRVVSLPTSEVSLAHFQPSEKTLLLSSTCKTSLETRYTQLYQSINDGHPTNRLNQLRQLLPRIKEKSTPKQGYDSKTSMDQSRPRRPKGDKYKFVDRVEESRCIWDVDRTEARVLAAEGTEAAQAKAAAKSTSTDSFVQNSSSSRDSFGFSNTYHDSPLAAMDSSNMTAGLSPSSAATSMSRPLGMMDSTSTFSLEPIGHSRSSKDLPGDSRLRFSESAEVASPSQQTTPPTITFAREELPGIQEAAAIEASPSKRNSFLGIFGARGKKLGHDGSESSYQESPQSTSAYGSPRLNAFGANQERRSLDSPQSPRLQPAGPIQANQRAQPIVEVVPPSSFSSPSDHLAAQGAISGFSSKRTSLDEEHRTNHFGDPGSAAMTDDDNGSHWAPPAFWPQGERMDDSQDESDTALAAAHKRSSIRRLFTDKMWKRGPKALSSIHPHPVESNISSPDAIGAHSSPRTGPQGVMIMSDSQARVEHKSPMLNPRTDSFNSTYNNPTSNTRSPLMQPSTSRPEKSPMILPTRNLEKSPLLAPSATFANEDGTTHQNSPALTAAGPIQTNAEALKPLATIPTSQLIIDVERIPKRLLDRLKLQPELASVEWKAETVDLSALAVSKDLLTYDEFVGITSTMKTSDMYPRYLDDIDVIQLHLTIGQEEIKDDVSKDRARKWDHLELRVDQELEQGDKWLKEITGWSKTKADAIERHCRVEDEGWVNGEWHLDASEPLVEEPVEEQGEELSASSASPTPATSVSMFSSSSSLGSSAMADQSRPDSNQVVARSGDDSKNAPTPYIAPLETPKARKQQRDLSLTSTREMHGSISSLHTTATTFTFKSSLDSTRESVAEMRVYLKECRDRLFQLEEATGAHLQEKEPVFKDIVDKFTTEWNGSYFAALKEVEDQIQVMNVKRIENPWMDMLLIMLSWVIRGLFYIVEGVTIMIIIVRHAWRKAKNGYEVVRNTRREHERLNNPRSGSGGHSAGSAGSITNGISAATESSKGSGVGGSISNGHAHGEKTVGAWSSN